MYRLRYEVYCTERFYLNAGDYPDQLELDEWDEYSVHFIAVSDNQVIGTSRLILDSPLGFPIERHFDLKLQRANDNTFAEVSRLIVRSRKLKLGVHVTNGLYKAMHDYSRKEDITDWCSILDNRLYRAYNSMGFLFVKIGEPRNCFGDITSPYVLSLSKTLANLEVVNPRLYDFIVTPFAAAIPLQAI